MYHISECESMLEEGGRMNILKIKIVLVNAHDYMQDNAIGNAGAQELARGLESNTSITHLNIGVCSGSSGGLNLALMIACRRM